MNILKVWKAKLESAYSFVLKSCKIGNRSDPLSASSALTIVNQLTIKIIFNIAQHSLKLVGIHSFSGLGFICFLR